MGYETRVSQAVSWVDECATEKAPQERCLLLISILLSTLHPAARQVRRGKKLLLERHVYSHRCHRVRQAPAERHGFALTAPPLKGYGMQNAIHAAPKGAWPSIRGGRYYKHGAPNGAGNIFVAQETYKVQALPMHSIRSGWWSMP